MQYFDTLPQIVTVDSNNNYRILTNLMARASVIPSLLKNPLLFYSYDIQDSDTPEIVAYKYYGDSYRYWMILFSNQLMDPLWDWPLNSSNFEAYINDKYTSFDPQSQVHHYEKIITQVDSTTGLTTTNTIIIDQSTYTTLTPTTNNYSLTTGNVTVSISKNAVSYYDYELNINEAKRSIKLINKSYASQLEDELKKLMS